MKPFIGSVLTIAIVAVAASFILENQEMSAQDVYQSSNGSVRLDNATK